MSGIDTPNKRKVVLDTSTLIEHEDILEQLIDIYDVVISIVTVEELDKLKTDKDGSLAFKARRAINSLNKHQDNIEYYVAYKNCFSQETNDNIIVSAAFDNDAYLITEDHNLKVKAKALGLSVAEPVSTNKETYRGFVDVTMSEEEQAYFYENMRTNIYDLRTNEYIVIRNASDGYPVEVRKWNGEEYVEIYNKRISTRHFGVVKPRNLEQAMAIDSIFSNDVTAITGNMGSGKSFISLVCAMKLVEDGKYDRITVFFNPTKARGAADVGYLPGTLIEKAMDNSIGNMLSSKMGDSFEVNNMIGNGQLRLVSMADIRGMEVNDTDILYITEAQNTSIDLMKLCMSRVGEGCKVILDGDYHSQVDNRLFENGNNGLRRVIEAWSGEDLFGFVELQEITRSKIAMLADKL